MSEELERRLGSGIALSLSPESVYAAEGLMLEAAETLKRYREALATASDGINEMFRYYDGGETRGSYDGRPERDKLRRAGYAVRQALAPKP